MLSINERDEIITLKSKNINRETFEVFFFIANLKDFFIFHLLKFHRLDCVSQICYKEVTNVCSYLKKLWQLLFMQPEFFVDDILIYSAAFSVFSKIKKKLKQILVFHNLLHSG